ncbi:hypothetical protein FE697_006690 [Mumia zhuanghuii]|uniref:Uncharacterized protein n=2 Tax=Mumia TaxID=1546255 RepID=A0ABW1QMK3_9ACTN|nr:MULTISPECIES: hypothetical protein [Mumia]KAA1423303.1 hypothetical protein FE697_006690 [Mumia zhuanghuii]
MIRVEFASKSAAYVSGPGSRALLVECGAKSPMFLPLRRVWATSPKVARDVLAACELRRIDVELVDHADDRGGGAP